MTSAYRRAGVRIYRSAKVDHLSAEAFEWEPLCGQRANGAWMPDLGHEPYPGTRLCYRCQQLWDNR